MLRVVVAVAAIAAAAPVARADVPRVEHAVLVLDDGEVVVRGHGLAGLQARWPAAAKAATCEVPEVDGGSEVCRFPASGSEAELVVGWAAGARSGSGSGSDGSNGEPLAIERTELAMLVRPDAVVDAFAAGGAIVALRHADRIRDVDCAPAACVLDGDSLLVSNVPAAASTLAIRVRLAPRVVLRRGDVLEAAPVLRVPIARCPLAVVSGPPLRGVNTQLVAVEIGGRCAREPDALRFQIAGAPGELVRMAASKDAAFALLRAGRLAGDGVGVAAMLDDGATVAQARVALREPPAIRVALAVGGKGIDFVPTNVAARARPTSADWDGTLAIAPIDGVYTTTASGEVRGVGDASGGSVALRVALHHALPAPLGDVEIARVAEPVQRALREATSVAPLLGATPLAELVCDGAAVAPGSTAHVAFDRAASCRLVFHRERLDPALGAQHLSLEVDVARVDGSPRSEAHVSRRIALAPDTMPRTLYLRPPESRFDRTTVQLSQDDDDTGLPAAQWSVVAGRGHARIYATSAIPTGLYRVSDRDHSGILTLNFGVLARATWLDSLGREGILCVEAGALTVGLAGDTSATGKSLTQVATVAGLGLAVPIANRALAAETSVNLHAWIQLEPSRAFGSGTGSAWAFVFGPSITVGNLGADL